MHAIAKGAKLPLPAVETRSAELYEKSLNVIRKRTDRLLANLMAAQWVAGIAAALWISPRTWIGTAYSTHLHLMAAIFLGGAISSLPIFLACRYPGKALTRHVMAVAQMLTSALFIHLTGGRMETHFHIFGSLAILAFYRDWRVLTTATVVVSLDHFARGVFWPQSVFGVMTESWWRWLEHAAWVLFEDIFLMIFIRQSLGDISEVGTRRAKLEKLNSEIEQQVADRTAELQATHKLLVDTSRRAGMAEVATNVLHNVGNVLNSVNVSAETVSRKVTQFRIGNLKNVSNLLKDHSGDLPHFLTQDPKGQKLPGYLIQLADSLAEPQKAILEEVDSLRKNIEHIKEVVTMQQSHARRSGMLEEVFAAVLVEDAIRLNSASFTRHSVEVVREFAPVEPLLTDRHQVVQILVNLLSNAKHAVDKMPGEKRLMVEISPDGPDAVRFTVKDNGTGIPAENLTRIFQHGFTTKKDGHGFGLHSGALAAQELGGTLTAFSEGENCGSAFTLRLPLKNLSSNA